MLPGNVLSDSAVFAPTYVTTKTPSPDDMLRAWEMGGVAISDASQGLSVKLWQLRGVKHDDSATIDVAISAPGVAETVLFSGDDITEIDLAFDQNMRPFVCYVQAGAAKYYWWDGSIPGYATVTMAAGVTNPRCCLDDHRDFDIANSDIILAYLRAGNLYYRQQRDRFNTERLLHAVGTGATLVYVAMNTALRLQFRVHNMTANTDGQTKVQFSPYLGDVVLALCKRVGIPAANIDTKELYQDLVPGYCVKTDDGADTWITPLVQTFFFDPTEYDRALHFYKRGRDPVMGISYTDLVASGSAADPMNIKVVDKTKLPKVVNVSYTDPTGGYVVNKQYAQRRSNQIAATGNLNIDTPLVLQPDQAATYALQALKAQWHELLTYQWELPLRFAKLVPGDTFDYFAKDGSTQRIRITMKNEQNNILKMEGEQDGGKDVYINSSASGLALPYPESTTPGLVGETRLELLNIPVLRDQDDELGIYIAFAGSNSAWSGAQILFSTDGVNYVEAYRGEVPATLGDLATELLPEVSAEYGDEQSFVVTTNFDLASISDDDLLNNGNRCVIGDEILQFQFATYLGSNQWRCSGLIRGRYNTKADHWPVGTRFVLLDTTVAFIQAQRWMLGTELWFKPVSFGLTEDESTPTTYEFDTAMSQWEWAPTHIMAVRDGSDNVQVDWIPRPRLGAETSPYNSKYFSGYRVVFSDGFNATTTSTTYTRSSCPAGVTVHVVPTNSITGDGETSQEVST